MRQKQGLKARRVKRMFEFIPMREFLWGLSIGGVPSVILWLVENDVKYGMQRRLRRYVSVSRKELINEIIARQKLEKTSEDIYKPNKPSFI